MNIGNLIISWDRGGVPADRLATVDHDYSEALRSGKRLILCTLAARSGTRWLGDVFQAHANATGITERYFEAESFYRYINYNQLPIDTAGIITLIKYGILQDWKKGDIAFVNSPFFSHGLANLYKELQPERIVYGINDPKFTVQSMYNKGFFSHHYIRGDVEQANGFQPNFPQRWYWLYLFARLVPNGPFYTEWLKLTRIGKIAWWGNMMNLAIWEQLEQLPRENVFIFHLKEADQNYAYYQQLAQEFGLAPLLSEKAFLAIKKQTVLPAHNREHVWDALEQAEFDQFTQEWRVLHQQLTSQPAFRN